MNGLLRQRIGHGKRAIGDKQIVAGGIYGKSAYASRLRFLDNHTGLISTAKVIVKRMAIGVKSLRHRSKFTFQQNFKLDRLLPSEFVMTPGARATGDDLWSDQRSRRRNIAPVVTKQRFACHLESSKCLLNGLRLIFSECAFDVDRRPLRRFVLAATHEKQGSKHQGEKVFHHSILPQVVGSVA